MGRKTIAIALGILIFSWIFWKRQEASQPQSLTDKTSQASPAPNDANTMGSVTPAAPIASSNTQNKPAFDSQALRAPLEIPTLETTREEVAKDPHTTPVSLLKFATQMAPKMEAALKDEKLATVFMETLSDCATGEVRAEGTLNPSAQALCYSNAKDLAKVFPSLKSAFQTVQDKTSELVKKRAI